MKIIVTGGAGFIGSHIADAYINDGHEVIVIDNLSTGRRENINPRAKFHETDICDPDILKIFEDERPQILNHHAAQIDVRKSVRDPLGDLKVNVSGLINLVECGRKTGLEKVILASSGGTVYGEQEKFPATEDDPLRPISPYGLNKLASEQYLFYAEHEYGIPYVALRYANVYGPRQNPHGEAGVVAIFAKKMLAGETPVISSDGRQTRDYVYIGDVVEANRLALTMQKDSLSPCGRGGRVYNIGTGVETDVNSIFRAIREFAGSTCRQTHGPAKSGEQMRSVISSAKIKRELGWQPGVTFAEGMRMTTQWFKDRK